MRMQKYAVEQTSALLARLAFRVCRTARRADAHSVHDLRVAIHRFAQSLRLFGEFLPKGECKKIRRRLRRIARAAAEVRNRDVALALCKEAGLPSTAAAASKLREERKEAEQKLIARLGRLAGRDFSRRWRQRLDF